MSSAYAQARTVTRASPFAEKGSRRLRIDIVEGADMTNDDELAGVFLDFRLNGKKTFTSQAPIGQSSRRPLWDEGTIIELPNDAEDLELNAWLSQQPQPVHLGVTRIPFGMFQDDVEKDRWYDIAGGESINARVRLRLTLQTTRGSPTTPSSPKYGTSSPKVSAAIDAGSASKDFRHGILLFEINARRVPYVVIPRNFEDPWKLFMFISLTWGVPSPTVVARPLYTEGKVFSEWFESCDNLHPWAPGSASLTRDEESYSADAERLLFPARGIPGSNVTKEVMEEYYHNFLASMEALALDICQCAAESHAWIDCTANVLGAAGLLGIGARSIFRARNPVHASNFLWLGTTVHSYDKQSSFNASNELWEHAVKLDMPIGEPLKIPLEETPQLPQSRTVFEKSVKDRHARLLQYGKFLNPYVTHLLVFENEKDLTRWRAFLSQNMCVTSIAFNDVELDDLNDPRFHRTVVINHSGSHCDRVVETLRQEAVKRTVERLNQQRVFKQPIEYDRVKDLFAKLGSSWARAVLKSMEDNALRPRSFVDENAERQHSHVRDPNMDLEMHALQHEKNSISQLVPPIQLPSGLSQRSIYVVNAATDDRSVMRNTLMYAFRAPPGLEDEETQQSQKKTERQASQSLCTRPLQIHTSQPSRSWQNPSACVRHVPKRASASDGRSCRFCFGEGRGGPDHEDLIAPCPCRGGRSLAHPACLLSDFTARKDDLNFKCVTCGNFYEGAALLLLAEASKQNLALMHGSRSPSVARALYHIGLAQQQLGDYKASLHSLAESLNIDEEHFRGGSLDTIPTFLALSRCYKRPRDVHKRRHILERCLELQETFYGKGHAITRTTLAELADCEATIGNDRGEQEILESVSNVTWF